MRSVPFPSCFPLLQGGYDSGFLYHCKFSEKLDEDPDQQQDEPFDFLPVHNTDDDPIRSLTFRYLDCNLTKTRAFKILHLSSIVCLGW